MSVNPFFLFVWEGTKLTSETVLKQEERMNVDVDNQ